jgi:hypothetical protein
MALSDLKQLRQSLTLTLKTWLKNCMTRVKGFMSRLKLSRPLGEAGLVEMMKRLNKRKN